MFLYANINAIYNPVLIRKRIPILNFKYSNTSWSLVLFSLQIARPFQDKRYTIWKYIYKCYCFFGKCIENWAIYYCYIRCIKTKQCLNVFSWYLFKSLSCKDRLNFIISSIHSLLKHIDVKHGTNKLIFSIYVR